MTCLLFLNFFQFSENNRKNQNKPSHWVIFVPYNILRNQCVKKEQQKKIKTNFLIGYCNIHIKRTLEKTKLTFLLVLKYAMFKKTNRNMFLLKVRYCRNLSNIYQIFNIIPNDACNILTRNAILNIKCFWPKIINIEKSSLEENKMYM